MILNSFVKKLKSIANCSLKKIKLPKIINDEKITSNKKNQPCNKNVTFKNVDLKCNGNANRCARDS